MRRMGADVRFWCLYVLVSLLSTPAETEAQGMWDRSDRIVISSPHFDALPELSVGCRGYIPLHLLGVPGGSVADSMGILTVKTAAYPRRDGLGARAAPLGWTGIQFRTRIDGNEESELPPRGMWRASADSSGSAQFRVPAGVYRIRFQLIGYRGGEGVIRVRAGGADILLAYLTESVMC